MEGVEIMCDNFVDNVFSFLLGAAFVFLLSTSSGVDSEPTISPQEQFCLDRGYEGLQRLLLTDLCYKAVDDIYTTRYIETIDGRVYWRDKE